MINMPIFTSRPKSFTFPPMLKYTKKAIIKDIKRNNIRFYVVFETHRVPDASTILEDAKKRKYFKVLVTVPDSYQKYFIKGDDSGGIQR